MGDLLERDPESVADDINGDYILPRFADAHGVVVREDADGHWSADAAATVQRRQDIRKERIAGSITVEDWMASQRDRVRNGDFIEPVLKMYRESADLSEQWAADYRAFWDLPDDWAP